LDEIIVNYKNRLKILVYSNLEIVYIPRKQIPKNKIFIHKINLNKQIYLFFSWIDKPITSQVAHVSYRK